ncbi:MAG TPA: pseudouridine synthase [Candidatus Moranbacteria bacterium]|nr:pseudouridine synthase [Candidatus Moranbacteria bacterium]
MRINKYLAQKNVASRREADALIKSGKVTINGRKAVLGDKIEEADLVEINPDFKKEYIYLAFNKPKGIITHSPQGKEKSIADILNFSRKVFPVGRLDKDSHGIIILTNDGRITGKILGPEHNHEKEYLVRVDKAINPRFVTKMGSGVILDDGYKTKKSIFKKINENFFSIVLTEGKKRQIRRMCVALGYNVIDLQRVRILNIRLGSLQTGQFRKISGRELQEFLSQLGFGMDKINF